MSSVAKFGGPRVLGEFTIGFAIAAPIFMFSNLQLRAVQATDIKGEYSFAQYFSLRLICTFLGFGMILLTLPWLGNIHAVRGVIALVALSKSIECMSDVTAGFLQQRELLNRVSISQIIRGVSSASLFAITFKITKNLEFALIVVCLVWLATFIFYDLVNVIMHMERPVRFFTIETRSLRRLAMLGLPLGWAATFASIYVNVPRYFLQHYRGYSGQGIYAALAYMVVGINLIAVALSAAASTRLARLYVEQDFRGFLRIVGRLCAIGGGIGVFGVLLTLAIGRPLLRLIYSEEYAEHVQLLAGFVAVASVSAIGTFLFCGLTAARMFRAQAPVYLVAVVAGLVGATILVPRYGLGGGAWSLFLSVSTVMIGGILLLRRTIS